jgi:hypothetical protein
VSNYAAMLQRARLNTDRTGSSSGGVRPLPARIASTLNGVRRRD